MSKLPRDLSGYQVVRALTRAGYRIARRHGSHRVLERADVVVTVPDHKVVREGTLRRIIRDAGLTVREFLELV